MLLINYAYRLQSAEAASRVAYAIQTDEKVEAQYRKVLQMLKDNPDIDPEVLLKKLGRTGYDEIPEKKPFFTSVQKWVAAAIFILVAGAVLFYYHSFRHSPEHLALKMIQEKNESPYSSATRGNASTDSVAAWEDKFANNEFSSVISTLEKERNRSEKKQFFLALSYLKVAEPQPEKAAPLFMQLAQYENQFTSDAWLYLGLSQALLHHDEQAIASFQHIEQTTQVKELEDRLRK